MRYNKFDSEKRTIIDFYVSIFVVDRNTRHYNTSHRSLFLHQAEYHIEVNVVRNNRFVLPELGYINWNSNNNSVLMTWKIYLNAGINNEEYMDNRLDFSRIE
jgi:hypothetical protein